MRSILDVSNIVYGGYHGSPNYRISGFPCGGIRKLLGMINADMDTDDFVLCFDGNNVQKKELFPEYKAGRVPNYAVIAQLDLLKEILLDCNIPFYYEESMEADDFVCSFVHCMAQLGDFEDTMIYSDDRDLACCVGDNVQLRHVTSNGSAINRSNFERHVVPGKHVPFNTILLYKLVYGDKSDCYGGLKLPGLRFDDLVRKYTEIVKPHLDSGAFPPTAIMDIHVFEAALRLMPEYKDPIMFDPLMRQAKIVFPRLTDITQNGLNVLASVLASREQPRYKTIIQHTKAFNSSTINLNKFNFYCTVLGLNKCRPDRAVRKFTEMEDEFKTTLKLRAHDLSSGVMAVERYRNKHANTKETAVVLENMSLPYEYA